MILAAYIGIKAPELYLRNATDKTPRPRIKRAWPDALDLLLICAESGSSMEQAFRRVSTEVGRSSLELAEEMALTTAELSYLPERRMAYENLAARTGLEPVQSVVTALVQAERYGTPIGQGPARARPGEPRYAHERGREESRSPASQADSAR